MITLTKAPSGGQIRFLPEGPERKQLEDIVLRNVHKLSPRLKEELDGAINRGGPLEIVPGPRGWWFTNESIDRWGVLDVGAEIAWKAHGPGRYQYELESLKLLDSPGVARVYKGAEFNEYAGMERGDTTSCFNIQNVAGAGKTTLIGPRGLVHLKCDGSADAILSFLRKEESVPKTHPWLQGWMNNPGVLERVIVVNRAQQIALINLLSLAAQAPPVKVYRQEGQLVVEYGGTEDYWRRTMVPIVQRIIGLSGIIYVQHTSSCPPGVNCYNITTWEQLEEFASRPPVSPISVGQPTPPIPSPIEEHIKRAGLPEETKPPVPPPLLVNGGVSATEQISPVVPPAFIQVPSIQQPALEHPELQFPPPEPPPGLSGAKILLLIAGGFALYYLLKGGRR